MSGSRGLKRRVERLEHRLYGPTSYGDRINAAEERAYFTQTPLYQWGLESAPLWVGERYKHMLERWGRTFASIAVDLERLTPSERVNVLVEELIRFEHAHDL